MDADFAEHPFDSCSEDGPSRVSGPKAGIGQASSRTTLLEGLAPSLLLATTGDSRLLGFFAVGLYWASALLSRAEIPLAVDLLATFSPSGVTQHGDTCHIYAAAELFEAACFRRTGRSFKLSEAHHYLLHLRAQAADARAGSYSDGVNWSSMTVYDRGRAEVSLRRLLDGQGLAVQEFPVLDDSLETSLREVSKPYRARYGEIYEQMKKGALSDPEAVLAQRPVGHDALEAVLRRLDKGAPTSTRNPALLACLKDPPLLHQMTPWSRPLMHVLLASGHPVLCSTPFVRGGTPGTTIPGDWHVFMVLGYRPAEKVPGGTEYLVLDPVLPAPVWGYWFENCRPASWLD